VSCAYLPFTGELYHKAYWPRKRCPCLSSHIILSSKERLAVDGSPHPVQVAPFGEFQGVKHKADGGVAQGMSGGSAR